MFTFIYIYLIDSPDFLVYWAVNIDVKTQDNNVDVRANTVNPYKSDLVALLERGWQELQS